MWGLRFCLIRQPSLNENESTFQLLFIALDDINDIVFQLDQSRNFCMAF